MCRVVGICTHCNKQTVNVFDSDNTACKCNKERYYNTTCYKCYAKKIKSVVNVKRSEEVEKKK